MPMKTSDILSVLSEMKPLLIDRFKVREVGLFGSFVRGDQTENSDIDVLVDFQEDADLFDLIGLSIHLEKVLQRKVDVVPKRALREEFKETVMDELIAL